MAGDQRKALGSAAESYRKAQPYVDAIWQFVGAVGLCTFGGWWADKHFHTQPWLLVAGATVGFATGMTTMFRVILVLDAKEKAQKDAARKDSEQEPR